MPSLSWPLLGLGFPPLWLAVLCLGEVSVQAVGLLRGSQLPQQSACSWGKVITKAAGAALWQRANCSLTPKPSDCAQF